MIISSIYNEEELNNINYLDGAIIMAPKFAINYGNINLDKAINILLNQNKMAIIGMDQIFTEERINEAISIIDKYLDNKDIYFYVSDIGLINHGIEKKEISRFIFDSKTMITNYEDAKIYSSFGMNALGLSNEITYKDALLITKEAPFNYFYFVFGKKIMFNSKRKILSIYKEYKNIKNDDKVLYISEPKKNNSYPLVENEYNLSIYRDYIISYHNDLNNPSEFKYLYLDSFDIKPEIYTKILKSYYDYFSNLITKEEFIKNISDLNLNIKDGFKYFDTIYQKEEILNG